MGVTQNKNYSAHVHHNDVMTLIKEMLPRATLWLTGTQTDHVLRRVTVTVNLRKDNRHGERTTVKAGQLKLCDYGLKMKK